MKKKYRLFLSLVIIGAVAAARAQQSAGGVGEHLFPMVAHVLTAQQRQSLQQALESQRDQIRPLVEKLQASRQALLDQVMGGSFDESRVRQDAAQFANAEADLTVIVARAFSKMQPPLSAQQMAQLKNFRPEHLRERRNGVAEDESGAAPEAHLKLPPPLPTDTNGLPVVN